MHISIAITHKHRKRRKKLQSVYNAGELVLEKEEDGGGGGDSSARTKMVGGEGRFIFMWGFVGSEET